MLPYLVRKGSLKPGRNCAIPMHLSGLYAVDFRKDERGDSELEGLLRAIFAEPKHKPPELGNRPKFLQKD